LAQAYQLSYADGNQSCSNFPWFAWPSQILATDACKATGPSQYTCHLCHNATMCLTDMVLLVDPHAGTPLRAEFVGFGQVFTTINFQALAKTPDYLFAVPPVCTAPPPVAQPARSFAPLLAAQYD
jgi:hypothetical protein